MDRRYFIKAAVAIPAAAAVPSLADARPVLNLASIKAVISSVRQGVDSPWYAIIHPQQERALRDMAARERWRGAYRDWRKDGRPELTYSQILEKYRPTHVWETDVSEIGSYEGFRFVVSESLPL